MVLKFGQLLDTDLITIKIWSKYKYRSCDKWILSQIEKQKAENRYYLLCSNDIPWHKDTQRENPHNRDELLRLYKDELLNLKYKFFLITGYRDQRLKNAIKIVNEINFQ